MIEVKNLTKSFNEVKAVDDVSFFIKSGDIVGLLGPNGAGKTTTMRMLTGFLAADNGDAVIGGNSISENPLEVKKQIGYLPENSPLYDDMVVEDYLYFMGSARGIPESNIHEAIKKMITACSLKTHLKKTNGQLSRGFKQRVGLAATMIHEPEVLILDEPTAGLDPNQIAEIRGLIIELGKEKTVILSTHIMQEVQETCNKVLIISEGKLIADDSVSNIMSGSKRGNMSMTATIKASENPLPEISRQPFVLRAEPVQSDQEGYAIRLLSERHPGENLFKLAVEKGWIITEMQNERQNLESVFRELTKSLEGGK
jgi:ABC-2 type transport system ATP-binding protein